MIQGRMLDNGKPQTGSAARLGPTLVHAIEPLKYLALYHHATLDLSSELGVGTTITVTFPIQQDEPFA